MTIRPLAVVRALAVAAFVGSAGVAMAEPLALSVADASMVKSTLPNSATVKITLAADSTKAFGDFTSANVGRKVAILIDGHAVMTPVIRDPITGGSIEISGDFDGAEWKDIARRLKAGEAKLEVDLASD